MIKVFEKCAKCMKECKCWSESKTKLLECPDYISKRSTKLNESHIRPENLKSIYNIGLNEESALNRKSPVEFE